MSSLGIAAGSSIRHDESFEAALLLAFAGGHLDAYAWIIHGVMANAQTANLIFLWVYGTMGEWGKALHFVPPILAFAGGVVIAAWLRQATGERTATLSILIEIVLLVVIAVLHNRLPDLAGTLGISFVAAMQASTFTKVEGGVSSTVMITGNMRQAIEAMFAAVSGGKQPGMYRRSGVLTSLCAAFGVGAAVGAVATKTVPDLSLGIPVIALVIVLLRCELQRREEGS